MEQLLLFPKESKAHRRAVPYDREIPYCVWDDNAFNWHACFSAFVNFDYWDNRDWILIDYRDAFEELTGVFLVYYVLDGHVDPIPF